MSLTEKTTVAEITAELPSSVRVFQRYGIDFCCGGKRALAVVCRDQGVSSVRNYLSDAISKVGGRDRVDAARITRQEGWL
jgi:iron-sulfur cluster repair protein YtfE (RIC family)